MTQTPVSGVVGGSGVSITRTGSVGGGVVVGGGVFVGGGVVVGGGVGSVFLECRFDEAARRARLELTCSLCLP